MLKMQVTIYISPEVHENSVDTKQILKRISQDLGADENGGQVYDSEGYQIGLWEFKVVK